MTAVETPRYTVRELIADRFTVMDAQTGQGIAYVCDRDEAQAKADAMNKLDSLGVQAGDTVVGLTTGSHPRQITVTVDRSPWISGITNATLSDGRSVEAVQLDSLRIIQSASSREDERPLTIDAVVDAVTVIRRKADSGDWDAAVSRENELYTAVLRAVVADAPQARVLASLTLDSQNIDFPRS